MVCVGKNPRWRQERRFVRSTTVAVSAARLAQVAGALHPAATTHCGPVTETELEQSGALSGRLGQSADPSRVLCYCFRLQGQVKKAWVVGIVRLL